MQVISCPDLTSISLPALEIVGGNPNPDLIGSLIISGNEALTTLSLPALLAVAADVTITTCPALTTCTGAAIVNVGDCVQ